MNAEVEVTFDEAAFGGKKVIHLQDGNGRVQSYEVNIPAGIESGKSIRLRGKGQPGVGGGQPGDLILKVNVREKPGFRRGRRGCLHDRVRSVYHSGIWRRGFRADD